MIVVFVVGIILVAVGIFVLLRERQKPGITISYFGFEFSSVEAGLPLVILGVFLVVIYTGPRLTSTPSTPPPPPSPAPSISGNLPQVSPSSTVRPTYSGSSPKPPQRTSSPTVVDEPSSDARQTPPTSAAPSGKTPACEPGIEDPTSYAPFPNGWAVREQSSPDVFIAAGGALFHQGSSSELHAMGYQDADIQIVPDGTLAPYRGVVSPKDGTAIRDFQVPDVYLAFGGTGFYEANSLELHSHFAISDQMVVVLPKGATARVVRNPARNGILVREHNGTQTFVVRDGQLILATPCATQVVSVVPEGSLARRF